MLRAWTGPRSGRRPDPGDPCVGGQKRPARCETACPKLAHGRGLVDVIFEQPYCRIANTGGPWHCAAPGQPSRYLHAPADLGVLEARALGKEKLFVHPRLLQALGPQPQTQRAEPERHRAQPASHRLPPHPPQRPAGPLRGRWRDEPIKYWAGRGWTEGFGELARVRCSWARWAVAPGAAAWPVRAASGSARLGES